MARRAARRYTSSRARDVVRGDLLHTKALLPLRAEMAILLASMGVMIPLGYAIFRRVERRCRALGTIGLH